MCLEADAHTNVMDEANFKETRCISTMQADVYQFFKSKGVMYSLAVKSAGPIRSSIVNGYKRPKSILLTSPDKKFYKVCRVIKNFKCQQTNLREG